MIRAAEDHNQRDARHVYLATPYSKFEAGLHMAHIEACRLVARLLRLGIVAYSPIAYTHPIAMHGRVDPLDHELWLKFDAPQMEAAQSLLVAQLPGWDESYGIVVEIEYFKRAGKPVRFLHPGTMLVSDQPFEVTI